MALDYQEGGERYAGYDKIMGNISWLLIALVSLDIKLIPLSETSTRFLTVFCLLLLIYNIMARYLVFSRRSSQIKTFIDLMVFLCFIVAVSWFTGRETSPFISLMYLVLMATSLTQGKRVTYFMAALAISSYVLLAANQVSFMLYRHAFVSHILELFPFMLIAHLGAMLSGEAESARREIERLSQTDEITGLHNMRNFFHLAEIQERAAKRYGKNYALCMLDADNLKKVNDRFGHLAGTAMIRHVGEQIAHSIRCSDIAARYGGDEFIIMFTENAKEEAIDAVARILKRVEENSFEFHGSSLTTTLSAGIASYPADGDDLKSVMALADEALFVSKKEGKNRITLHQTTSREQGHPATVG
jgi:diguanylate cyclase (GGDEF)-like protein